MNKIAVLGATGRTGKLFTPLALNRGMSVRALVRDPSTLAIQHANLQVIQGDAADPVKVEETIQGTEAVVDLLGPGKASLAEWQRLAHLRPIATGNILSAMQQNHVDRLIVVSSVPFGLMGGVFDPKDQLKFKSKWFINP